MTAMTPTIQEDIATVAALRMEAFFAGAERTYREDCAGLRQLLVDHDAGKALVARIDGNVAGTVLLVPEELDAAHDLTPWRQVWLSPKRIVATASGPHW